MTWYILRHANKEAGDFFNPRLHHQDQPISAKGREEAHALCSAFAGKPVAAIYVSAYQRTGQTIAEVAAQHGLTPIVDERLNEIDNGLIDSMSDEDVQHTYPDVWKAYVERAEDFRFPEGETGQEARQRIIGFLEEKRSIHAGQDVIIVSHDGLIRLLLCDLAGLPVYKRGFFRIRTCAVTEFEYLPESGAWRLVRLPPEADPQGFIENIDNSANP